MNLFQRVFWLVFASALAGGLTFFGVASLVKLLY
ncbi:uncharacterized protein METZ01_LOCUS110025 [marine metagenome]|uniref:Uncharacterized protein n=1 Tax=marine metagenome TaxID=408172 RepID=A0A381WY40_9ZZZZ